MNIKIPAISKSFYSDSEKGQILSKISEIKNKYGKTVSYVSSITNVPEDLIYSFIFIESAGNEKAVSSFNAVGLMQLVPEAATNVVVDEKKANRLLPQEEEMLKKLIGEKKLDCLKKMQYRNQPMVCNRGTGNVITKQDLLNPDLNILLGTMLLGQLIDLHTENGKVRLDKVIIRYNKGINTKPKGNTIEETVAGYPTETRNYVYKLVGKNGLLDILT